MLYNNQENQIETFWMKFALTLGFMFRILEIVCYVILFRVMSKHNDEMEQNKIISGDLNQARRRINLLSIYAHLSGFVAENFYIVFIILWRLARRTVPESGQSREFFNTLLIFQFAFVSTITVLASTDLRTKLFTMFQQ